MKLLAWPIAFVVVALSASGCKQQAAEKSSVADEFGPSPANATLAEKLTQLEKIRAETARIKARNDAAMDRTPEGRAARLKAEAEEQAKADKEKAEQDRIEASRYEWRYEAASDQMDGTQTRRAYLTSISRLEFGPPYDGGSRGDLMIRQRKKDGLSVLFGISKGQIICHSTCAVKVRFDDKAPITFTASPPADYSATSVFLSPASKFVSELAKANRTLVEVTYYQAGSQVSEFKTAGFVWDGKPSR